MRKIYKLAGFICLGLVLSSKNTNAQTVSDFENLTLTPNSFWDGSDMSGTHNNKLFYSTFISGDAIYPSVYDTTFGLQFASWSQGFAYSNMTDSTTAGFGNLFSARTARGVSNSSNYTVSNNNSIIKLSGNAANNTVSGVYITNTTYAAISMRDGDSFAKQFGSANDASGNPDGTNGEDWFLLTVKGYTGGILTTDSVNFYLADYRFANTTQDYIVTDWQWVDLTSLGTIDSVTFILTSSDVGQFGMNTPAFFALDNFNDQTVSVNNLVAEIDFSIYPNPANNHFYMNLKNDIETVQVIDITGKTILSETNLKAGTHQINVANLSAGIYFVKAISNNSTKVERFIKQ